MYSVLESSLESLKILIQEFRISFRSVPLREKRRKKREIKKKKKKNSINYLYIS